MGLYYVEPQTHENSRMDLVMMYGGEEFVIELKIWHDQKYETEKLMLKNKSFGFDILK